MLAQAAQAAQDASQVFVLWGFGLFAVALLLVAVEPFVPSGGIIGVTSAVCAIGSIVAFWRAGAAWGVPMTLATVILMPMAFMFALKAMPHTPLGKRLILGGNEDEDETRARAFQQAKAQREREEALIGATGVAITPLRSVGTIEIEGQRFEAIAVGGAVDAGQQVKIVEVSGNEVKVRGVPGVRAG